MNSFEELRGRVALITGGGSGIGLGAARVLSEKGMRVALVGHTPEPLQAAAAELGEAIAIPADVAKHDELRAAVRQIMNKWDRLDVVVANAGINGVWAPIEELQPEEWETTLTVNLTGTFLTVREALPAMKEGGSIIVTSSVNGTRMFSNTGATAYVCSKAGQVAFAKMMAVELAPRKIRCNVVCPGWIESDIEDNTEKRHLKKIQHPVEWPKGAVPLTDGAPGQPEQVGSVILFLASDMSSHVTGTEIWVDGGQSLVQG